MIRVNADYETELFTGGPGPKIVNESLEFLSFFLVNDSILSSKKYSDTYLDYIQDVTGHRPVIEKSGKAKNWWGSLSDLKRERELNSKVTSTKLSIERGWTPDAHIISDHSEILELIPGVTYLVKDPYGMSGRGFSIIQNASEIKLQHKTLIVEPLLKRKYDFSTYVFPDGKMVTYENLVDSKFQFKGSIFIEKGEDLINLPFYNEISILEWEQFIQRRNEIVEQFQTGLAPGFSIDSFAYEEDGELKIHCLSEVNVRRTMGLTAYEIGMKLAAEKSHWLFVMTKSLKNEGGFSFMKNKLQSFIDDKKIIILSPGDTRFEMFFLLGLSRIEILELEKEVMNLLTNA